MKNQVDFRLEEYKSLRAEIMHHTEALEKNIIACITATGVALTYGVKTEFHFLLALSCVVPVYFWIRHQDHRKSIAKLAAYIATFHEGPETQLMWETRIRDEVISGSRLHSSYLPLRRMLHPYPILLTVSLLTSIWSLSPSSWPIWSPITLSLLVFCSMLSMSNKVAGVYKELQAAWSTEFEAIKLREQSEEVETVMGPEESKRLSDQQEHNKIPGLPS